MSSAVVGLKFLCRIRCARFFWAPTLSASAHVDRRRMPFLHNLLLQHGIQDTLCIASFVFFLHYESISCPHAFCSEKPVSALGACVPHVCLYFCCWSSPVPFSSPARRSASLISMHLTFVVII